MFGGQTNRSRARLKRWDRRGRPDHARMLVLLGTLGIPGWGRHRIFISWAYSLEIGWFDEP